MDGWMRRKDQNCMKIILLHRTKQAEVKEIEMKIYLLICFGFLSFIPSPVLPLIHPLINQSQKRFLGNRSKATHIWALVLQTGIKIIPFFIFGSAAAKASEK